MSGARGSFGPLRDKHQDPDRWTQQTVPKPVPAGQGELASIQLGDKRDNQLSVYGYDKTRWATRRGVARPGSSACVRLGDARVRPCGAGSCACGVMVCLQNFS